MEKESFHQPDEEAMRRLLRKHAWDPTGLILRLAWLEGLSRREIAALTWDDVDFEAGLLRLPDREVPLEEETAEFLRRWNRRCAGFSGMVAVSDRLRKPMAEQSISTLARAALDTEGQREVRLQDLRYDYVRRQFREQEWTAALRMSGLSFSSYRLGRTWLKGVEKNAAARRALSPEDEPRLRELMQKERSTPAGIALLLTDALAMEAEAIVRLTWDDVDFDRNTVRFDGADLPMSTALRMALVDEKARRAPGDDPHVILTPTSRRPMDASRLGTLVRAALIRGGLETLSVSDLKRGSRARDEQTLLLNYAGQHGSVSRGEAAELLGVSEGMAYRRLLALTEQGRLRRVNSRYYPADSAVPPEDYRRLVLEHAADRGFIRREEAAELLHIGKRQAARLLREMAEDGELVLPPGKKTYVLPEPDGSTLRKNYKSII